MTDYQKDKLFNQILSDSKYTNDEMNTINNKIFKHKKKNDNGKFVKCQKCKYWFPSKYKLDLHKGKGCSLDLTNR